jgi:hypothetical protein
MPRDEPRSKERGSFFLNPLTFMFPLTYPHSLYLPEWNWDHDVSAAVVQCHLSKFFPKLTHFDAFRIISMHKKDEPQVIDSLRIMMENKELLKQGHLGFQVRCLTIQD